MKVVQIFLALIISAVAAIDVLLSHANHCGGPSWGCRNMIPDRCCTFNDAARDNFKYIEYKYVPGPWNITMFGMSSGFCLVKGPSNEMSSMTSESKPEGTLNDYCLAATWKGKVGFHSAIYNFFDVPDERRDVLPRREPDSNCTQADTLFLTDGTAYSLDGLDEDARNKTFKMVAENGAQAAIDQLGLTRVQD